MPITRAMDIEYYSRGGSESGLITIGRLEQRKHKVVLDVNGFRFKSEEADDLPTLFWNISQWAGVETTVGDNVYPRFFFKERGMVSPTYGLIGADFLSRRLVRLITDDINTTGAEMSVEELYNMCKERDLVLF